MTGFTKILHHTTNNFAEIIILLEGLSIACEHRLNFIEVNIDYIKILRMFLRNEHSFYNNIFDECMSLPVKLGNPTVRHCYREQSGAANILAKEGNKGKFLNHTDFLIVPPMCTREAAEEDINETTFARLIPACKLSLIIIFYWRSPIITFNRKAFWTNATLESMFTIFNVLNLHIEDCKKE